jgi:sulfatase modifying factor 1
MAHTSLVSMSRNLSLMLAVLVVGACEGPPLDDAGAPDAGRDDAGATDAGTGDDAGAVDAGDDDGGHDDAGTTDSGTPDDGGAVDAGDDDAGAPDAGDDGGAPDAGPLDDAGTLDAGPEACSVAGVEGTCTHVSSCDGASWLGTCDDAPAVQCCATDVVAACSVDGAKGACIDVASCAAPFAATAGKCPGAANIQCCTDPTTACDPLDPPTLNDGLPGAGLTEPALDDACPSGMVSAGLFCVDVVEASLVVIDDDGNSIASHSPFVHPTSNAIRAVSIPGAIPQAYIDGIHAETACQNAGKRLCTDDEWLFACRGPGNLTYPYGNTRLPGVCNDARTLHPAIDFFGTNESWIWSELGNACIAQLPDGLAPTGTHEACVSSTGAFDMMGNLHEWTSAPAGTFRGGFYVDTALNGNGCLYATTAHDSAHWDYSTGFRCCADPL